jgi:hypothetical protein
MAKFTIETTYRLPVFRQHSYEADTLEAACRLALEDDDWDDAKRDYDCSGETYVTGAWPGAGSAYDVPSLPVPGEFDEPVQRKADQFELLLGMLKMLAHVDDLQTPDLPSWLPRARALIAKAEAILAGAPDPDETVVATSAYVVIEIRGSRVREQIADILETDPELSPLSIDTVTDADIYGACVTAAAALNVAEEIGGAEFRAALAAIGNAERRLANAGGQGHA